MFVKPSPGNTIITTSPMKVSNTSARTLTCHPTSSRPLSIRRRARRSDPRSAVVVATADLVATMTRRAWALAATSALAIAIRLVVSAVAVVLPSSANNYRAVGPIHDGVC